MFFKLELQAPVLEVIQHETMKKAFYHNRPKAKAFEVVLPHNHKTVFTMKIS